MAKRTDTRPKAEHNYKRKLRYLMAVGALPQDVGVHQITIFHDSWCGIYRGTRCNCDPDITLAWTQPDASKN